MSYKRREFLYCIGGAALMLAPPVSRPLSFFAATPRKTSGPAAVTDAKVLTLYNTHTAETLDKCCFWENNAFNPGALKKINALFRDHRTNTTHAIDPKVLKLLHDLGQTLDLSHPKIRLISGFRSQKTNNLLRQRSKAVASRSYHCLGKAADIIFEGRTPSEISKAAKVMKQGGVGRYRSFVHIDVGPVRSW